MKIIEGFEKASKALSRQTPKGYNISPSLKKRLEEMFGTGDPEQAVKIIVENVRDNGDKALFDYGQKIDGVKLESIEVPQKMIKAAYKKVDKKLVSSLELAAERVRNFHLAQKNTVSGEFKMKGMGQIARPLERVGCYVPGGTASYPSTVLMTAIPARVAGVKEVVLTTPPKADVIVHPLTLVAADIARVDRVFAVGGAQAIAALAYGTETVSRVDKICGPGNLFVVLAKKLVYGVVGIDALQGPSEVIVIADETANPAFCASDILAQSEHDPLSSAILIATSRKVADKISTEIERQLKDLPRQAIASESLNRQGIIAVVKTIDEAIDLTNLYGPEHLCIMVDNAASYIAKVKNVGCTYAGDLSTVVMGDYVDGPSHVLPTGGTSRFSSPLNVMDFIKFNNWVTISEADLKAIGPAARDIAAAEGLDAHARAVQMRLDSLK